MKTNCNFLIVTFLLLTFNAGATHLGQFYVYHEMEYIQGPWSASNYFNNTGNYCYLQAIFHEEYFGTEPAQLAQEIVRLLKADKPDLYSAIQKVEVDDMVVVVSLPETEVLSQTVKNELITSMMMNNFSGVRLSQGIDNNNVTMWTMQDVTLPYFDLFLPTTQIETEQPDSNQISQQQHQVDVQVEMQEQKQKNIRPLWLYISLSFNLLLIILLVIKRTGK